MYVFIILQGVGVG